MISIFDEAQEYLNMIDNIKDHHERKLCECCNVIEPIDKVIKEPGEPFYYCLDCQRSGALEKYLTENGYPAELKNQILNLKPINHD